MPDDQKTIDISQLADELPEQEIDAGASVYDRPAPPPAARYQFQLQPIPTDKWKGPNKDKNGNSFYHTTAILKLVDNQPGSTFDGLLVREEVNTLVFARAKTSSVMSMAGKAGGVAPGAISPLKQALFLCEISQGTPLLEADIDWEGFAQHENLEKNADGTPKFKDGKEQFRLVGMKRFPAIRDEAGNITGYDHIGTSPWGEPVVAQPKVARLYKLGEK